MAIPIAAENEKLSFVTTGPVSADFESQCKGVILKTTADVHVAFDATADADDLLIEDGEAATYFPVVFTSVSAIGDSTSGTLYITGIR